MNLTETLAQFGLSTRQVFWRGSSVRLGKYTIANESFLLTHAEQLDKIVICVEDAVEFGFEPDEYQLEAIIDEVADSALQFKYDQEKLILSCYTSVDKEVLDLSTYEQVLMKALVASTVIRRNQDKMGGYL